MSLVHAATMTSTASSTLAGAVGVDAEALELGARRGAAGAELDAAVGDDVEDGGRLRRPHRMVVRERHQAHAVAEAQA
jgi:hypothetical protein